MSSATNVNLVADLGVAICGAGMVTPVGIGPAQTFASVLTGISRNAIDEDLYRCQADDPDFEEPDPVTVARIDYLTAPRQVIRDPVEWLGFLAAMALENLRETCPLTDADLARLGMFLALPPPRPGFGPAQHRDLAIHFHNHARQDLFPLEQLTDGGPAAGIALLETAARAVSEGKLPLALVGGVESFLHAPWLADLDRAGRLKSCRNLDGFIPGEGAAFLLLAPAAQAARRGGKPRGVLRAVATAKCAPSELQNNTGLTLAKLLEPLLTASQKPPLFLTDLNGEPERMREWAYVMSRLGARLGDPCRYEHPADALGDAGAAWGATLCGLAGPYARLKFPGLADVVCLAASDSGERAAVLLDLGGAWNAG